MQLKIRDAAKLLKVSESKVKEWIRRGVLRADRVNDQYQVHRSDLLERTASREINIPAEIFSPPDHATSQALSLVDALRRGGIFHNVDGAERSAVLRAVVDTVALPPDSDREAVAQLLLARETLGSTAIGEGIAIPHVRRPLLLNSSDASITLCFLQHPVDFRAFDGQPVFAIFLLISPTARTHLRLLSRLSFALHDVGLKAALARHASPVEVLAEFQRVEDGIRAEASTTESQS